MFGTSWAHRPRSRHGFSGDSGPCGWGGGYYFMHHGFGGEGFGRSGSFGMRRPLRVLAHKLDLDEQQTVALARILGDLKTERAQVEVDARRTMSDYADSLSGEAFDSGKATTAADRRSTSVVRMHAAIANALKEIHALLDPEQRGALAHLIRAGVLTL